MIPSGRFRNFEREVQLLAREANPKVLVDTPTFGHVKVRTEYLEATDKRLKISKELIYTQVITCAWWLLLHATAA